MENNNNKLTDGQLELYNELMDDTILWAFELSQNYNTYKQQSRDLKDKINKFCLYGRDLENTEWQKEYSNNRDKVIKNLFSFTRRQDVNIDFSVVVNDIMNRLKERGMFHNNNVDEKAKIERLNNLLHKAHSEIYRNSNELKRIANILEIAVENVYEVNVGASGCKKFEKEGKTYYIKPFFYSEKVGEKGINPKEPFLYKVLEYIGLGPRAEFFIGSGTSYGSNVSFMKTNYIMTVGEVLHFDDVKNKNEEKFYANFLNPNNIDNMVEITFASLIQSLLSLADVFEENQGNYGITDDNKFKFIDHLPGCNGLFDTKDDRVAENYSPKQHLEDLYNPDPRLKGILFNEDKKPSFLRNVKRKYSSVLKDKDVDKKIKQKVNERLFNGIPDRNILSLESAIEKAREDINTLIVSKEHYFIQNAKGELDKYISDKLLGRNLANYKRTQYYLQSGIGM